MNKDRSNLVKNSHGGLNDMNKDAIHRAQKFDLVTLPQDVRGTNCFNCKWIEDPNREMGYCKNQAILQYVNGRMCCALWDKNGAYRPFKKKI